MPRLHSRYHGWYILDENNKPVKASVLEAGFWMEANPDKRVVAQQHIGDLFISTVFLGVDHGFLRREDIPILWETMVFDKNKEDGDGIHQERHASHEAAFKGHVRIVKLIKAKKFKGNWEEE